jgi:hypothetical protein
MVSLVGRPNGSCYEPRPSVFEADLAGEPAYLHETSYRAQLYWQIQASRDKQSSLFSQDVSYKQKSFITLTSDVLQELLQCIRIRGLPSA